MKILFILLISSCFCIVHSEEFTVNTSGNQLYFVSKHNLDFSSFNKIGRNVNKHAPKLKNVLKSLGVKITGNLETQYTFIADPHGPDIPDGKFYIEIAFPVEKKVEYKGDYYFINKKSYKYISKKHKYPPYSFPWQTLREYVKKIKYKRTLKERDYHLKLKVLGDKENIMECRVEVENNITKP